MIKILKRHEIIVSGLESGLMLQMNRCKILATHFSGSMRVALQTGKDKEEALLKLT